MRTNPRGKRRGDFYFYSLSIKIERLLFVLKIVPLFFGCANGANATNVRQHTGAEIIGLYDTPSIEGLVEDQCTILIKHNIIPVFNG